MHGVYQDSVLFNVHMGLIVRFAVQHVLRAMDSKGMMDGKGLKQYCLSGFL